MSERRRLRSLMALVASLVLVAAACGTEGETGESGDSGSENGGEAGPEFSTLEEGVLTVGSDIPYPPFEFREGGTLKGLDVDLIKEIATRLELEVQDSNIIDTSFNTIFNQLEGGRFDVVVAATTVTPEREETVNFSDPYYNSQQSLTVESGSDIQSVDDLQEGTVVGVQNGTTGKAWAEENLEGVTIRSFPQGPDGYTALEAGAVDAVINDEPTALAEVEARGDSLELVETIDTGEVYGIAVDPNNSELLDAINESLAEIIEDGTYQEIYDRYPDLPPGGSVAQGG